MKEITLINFKVMSNNNLTPIHKKKSEIIETSEGLANKEGVEQSTPQLIVELVEYVPNSILRKTILKKATGSVTVSSFDSEEALSERISPFSTFIQIIEGKAEIVIAGKSTTLQCGESIIIPAHAAHIVKADGRFKMLQTVIKSGYDI
jgi:quercetin dioxygenase-like cupin family protein